MITPQDEQAIDKFFYTLSEVMNSAEIAQLLSFYHLPSVFVSDEEKTVCSTPDQVSSRLLALFAHSNNIEKIEHQATVVHVMSLSDSILFAKVDWRICDENNQMCTTCSTSYTLERGGMHGFDIIVSVIDEEERALDDLQAQIGA
ncbi:hypothetical protein [Alteromonas oceanisediminis]|uniref:hypothetical protein n=1 Tax=Alteromonas oceanisediminis TaxID=2836180 RepID=UPI001BDAC78A|nr:hypothetical protein [Alteromonas oceanisediminis]MBT0584798.1 hypothetical protein [Alteromonas oceanisediminis]